MPSCVVKMCKNNSTSHKKSDGITFHNFPKDPIRRNVWIEIIRNCRSNNKWSPSSYSLICSLHFEEQDLYMTTNGLRRVTRTAIPKKDLFYASIQQNINLVKSDSSECSRICQNVAFDSKNIKLEDEPIPETPSYTQPVLHDVIKTETCEVTTDHSHLCDPSDRGQSTIEFSVPPMPSFENGLILDSPDKEHLVKQLKRREVRINNDKKKIKLLNQNIKELIKQNKSLKFKIQNFKHCT